GVARVLLRVAADARPERQAASGERCRDGRRHACPHPRFRAACGANRQGSPELRDRAPGDAAGHARRGRGGSDAEGAMAGNVDQTRDAARVRMDDGDRATGEEAPRLPSRPHAMCDVLLGLAPVEAPEVPAYGDPLVELLEIRTRQELAQL